MAQGSLEVGMRCIKYMLMSVTVIFMLTSALIISVGTSIYAIFEEIQFFLQGHFYTPATLIIAIGVIMLFVSLFGCIGAFKESTCFINIFAVILSLVFILEVAASIAAYSLRGKIDHMLDQTLRQNMHHYYEDEMVSEYVDFLQNRMNCCGADSYQDWAAVIPPPGTSGIVYENMTIPNSCCAQTEGKMVDNEIMESCTKLYANGCLPRLFYILYQSAGLLGAGALTIAFIQIIGIVFSFSLASAIRKAKSEREHRRWEIKERVINARTSLNPDGEKYKPVVYVPFHGQTIA
ncbi:unnamed protein product [Chilo suppressalis]|uniref:Tetraspanin n=1 Tax=Chilo suppressalis TaxID=168631 RepID=A0ABN8BA27_CHISP|nr:unnamed protein product [Chilo suppressalis]